MIYFLCNAQAKKAKIIFIHCPLKDSSIISSENAMNDGNDLKTSNFVTSVAVRLYGDPYGRGFRSVLV